MVQCSLDPVWLVALPIRDQSTEGKSVFDSCTDQNWPSAYLEPHLLTGTEAVCQKHTGLKQQSPFRAESSFEHTSSTTRP